MWIQIVLHICQKLIVMIRLMKCQVLVCLAFLNLLLCVYHTLFNYQL